MTPLAIGPTSLDWPAWVQAVGSIVAIAVAIIIAARDSRRRYKDKIYADAVFARHSVWVADQIISSYNALFEIMKEYRPEPNKVGKASLNFSGIKQGIENLLEHIKATARPLASVPLTAWPDMALGNYFSLAYHHATSFPLLFELIEVTEAKIGKVWIDESKDWKMIEDHIYEVADRANVYLKKLKVSAGEYESRAKKARLKLPMVAES